MLDRTRDACDNGRVARFLTLNTFLLEVRLFGRLHVYPPAPWAEKRLAALPAALAATGADVIALQEVYRRPHRRFLADTLAGAYPYTAGLEHSGIPLGTGLMVLSRHPIAVAEAFEFRAALVEERIAIRKGGLECRVRFPDLGTVRFINFHLVAGGLAGHPEERRGETCRSGQIDELAARADTGNGEPVVMLGDLNAGTRASPANYRRMIGAGFRDAVGEAGGGDLVSWDPGNPLITGERNRSLPPQRMDQILIREAGSAHLAAAAAAIVLDERAVDVGEEAPLPLSDHYGVAVDIVVRERPPSVAG